MDLHACRVLEFPALLELLTDYTACDNVRRQLRAIEPATSLSHIKKRHPLCRELMSALAAGMDIPRLEVPDLAPVLRRARPEDACLSVDDFMDCRKALLTAQTLALFARTYQPDRQQSELQALAQSLDPMEHVLNALEQTFGDDGEINDSASPALRRIRQRTEHANQQIRQTLERLLRASWTEDVLQEKFVTIRNGRHVVPVRREMKSRLPGVVHDHSDSGHTLFMEPSQTLSLGNELADLLLEERDECRRILAALSARIRYSRSELAENQRVMLEFACTAAIARWATEYACTIPVFGDTCELRGARHPLLEHQFRTEGNGEQIVPLPVQTAAEKP